MRETMKTKVEPTFEVTAIESVYYQEFRQPYGRPMHEKTCWQMIYIVRGERDMILNGENITLHQNEFVCIPPHTPRQNLETRQYCDVCCINFFMTSPNPMELMANLPVSLFPSERDLLMKVTHITAENIEIYKDMKQNGMRPSDSCTSLAFHSIKLYMELLILIIAGRVKKLEGTFDFFAGGFEQHESMIVTEIKLYFAENLDKVLTIRDISEHFNISEPTLKVLFKKATGDSIIHFFNDMKMERARSLMHTTDLSISEISEKLGFCSPTHFSTTFKKFEKMSPTEYMEYCRKHLPHLNRSMRHGTGMKQKRGM